MDKELQKYINRSSNLFVGELKVTRDVSANGWEYIRICLPDGKELYTHWHNPNKKPKSDTPPKHTGGKKPYLMLMVDEIEKLRKDGVKNVEELIGYIVCLGKSIEWNTGRLIHKKSKEPLRYVDLLEIYGCSKPKLNKMLRLMKENELLYHTDSGYYVSPRYIKRGKMKGDNRNVL
jgi:hypothetical protein